MKKTITKITTLIYAVILLISFSSFGQVVVFTESMGILQATTSIAIHETANGFDKEDFIVTDDGAVIPHANFTKDVVYEVTVDILPESAGTVTGAGNYPVGEIVELTAEANVGYSFICWEDSNGNFLDTAKVYKFFMPTQDVHVVAVFEINVHVLTLVANPFAGGTVSGGGYYEFGAVVPVSATPNTGYEFANWSIGANIVCEEPSFDYTMPDNDVTLTANFYQMQTFTLTLIAEPEEGGEVFGAGEYLSNEVVTVNAVPADNSLFDGWFIGTTLVSVDAEYTFNMPAEDLVLTAKFSLKPAFNLTLIAEPEEGGDVLGEGEYTAGTIINVQAVANVAEGWSFLNWTDEGDNIISTLAEFDYEMPVADVTLTANFTDEDVFVVSVEVSPDGAGTVTGTGNYTEGADVKLTAEANVGYSFIRWEDEDGVELETAMDYEFEMPVEDVHVIAVFEINVHTLTLVANPAAGGTVSGGGDYEFGTVVTVSATGNIPYIFECWSIGTDIVSINETFDYTMPDHDVTLTANFFRLSIFSLTLIAEPEEGGEVFGAGYYYLFDDVTVNAVPADNWVFDGWYIGETLVSDEEEYVFEMPPVDFEMTGKFIPDVSITNPSILNISMYPNPTRGLLNITSDRTITDIIVFDIIGKAVYVAQPDSDVVELLLTDVEPGMYFLRIYTKAGNTTKKLQLIR